MKKEDLNRQVIALEEAETKIRQTVKYEYLSYTPRRELDGKIETIIRNAIREVNAPALREAAARGLRQFYRKQYAELQRSFGRQIPVLSAVMLLSGKRLNSEGISPTTTEIRRAREFLEESGYGGARLMGVPMQRYSQDYIKKHVTPALDRLARQEAKDPDDISGRNSLRNRAEMEVRYQGHIDSVSDFRSRGVRLVIASAHSDCSARCRKWQGRVYSLDGTSGVTEDGRRYVPLEEATDAYYTTKAGKTYKNGLLGFNCRHYLVAYEKGYRFPKPNPVIEKREYEISEEQRRLERKVREWRTRAIEYKGVDELAYRAARKKAMEWNKAYIEFSKANRRAYDPSRTKII